MIYFISPGWNCEPFIKNWYESIINALRNCSHDYTIIAVNDGSTDNSQELLEEIAKKDLRVVLLKNDSNCGPAYSRWQAWKCVDKVYNSICINLDMDDYLTVDAISVIENHYMSGIKMTMGSIVNYPQAGKFYSKEDVDKNLFPTYNQYRGLAPLTYRSSLIKLFDDSDFKDASGNWLHHCSDVALTFSLLFNISSNELANIKKPIYIYNIRRDGTMFRFGNKKKEMYRYLCEKFNEKITQKHISS